MVGRTCIVGERGQIVIPERLRDELGIEPGDEVSVRDCSGSLLVRKRPSDDELAEAYRQNTERAERVNGEWSRVVPLER